MINYLELLEESSSFKEDREKPPQNECVSVPIGIIEIWLKGKPEPSFAW